MYEVEIVISRAAAHPFRVTGVQAVSHAQEIVESFLAAWGIPVPRSLRDNGSTFAERLAEAGEYREDGDGYLVVVKRAT